VGVGASQWLGFRFMPEAPKRPRVTLNAQQLIQAIVSLQRSSDTIRAIARITS
jgi:hypothetical protein